MLIGSVIVFLLVNYSPILIIIILIKLYYINLNKLVLWYCNKNNHLKYWKWRRYILKKFETLTCQNIIVLLIMFLVL